MAPTKSVVWDYFKKSENNTVVECTLCKKKLKFFKNTTNLREHLKRIHPVQIQSETLSSSSSLSMRTASSSPIEPTAGPSHTEAIAGPSSAIAETLSAIAGPSPAIVGPSSAITSTDKLRSPPPKRRQLRLFGVSNLNNEQIRKIDAALIKMIVKDYQPLSVVENSGFIEYTSILQPLYKIPSRKKISNDILPNLYAEKALYLREILEKISNVAITTDIWSSNSNKSFITVTCHYICNYEIHARVLATQEILGSHTGENISLQLREILNEWGVFDKVTTIVSDNAANMKNAINDYLQKHRHPCIAHTLNLSVQEALTNNSNLSLLLKKCKTIVGHFKHSVNASNKLIDVQKEMGFPVLKTKQDVPTRWNSTLIMLERLLKIKDPLSIVITRISQAPEFLASQEWSSISDCVLLLKPVELLTTALSGETYVTMSMVIPLIRGMQHTLKNTVVQSDIARSLQQDLLSIISRRLGLFESNQIASKATLLDPRFKKIGFELEENFNNAQKYVTEELIQILNRKQIAEIIPSQPVKLQTQSTVEVACDIWAHFDSKAAKTKTTTTSTCTAALMLQQYLELPYLERTKNPLEFWKTYGSVLPELFEMAQQYLCVPATSVPAERVFSKAGQITNLRRSSLSAKNLDKIIFLNSNL